MFWFFFGGKIIYWIKLHTQLFDIARSIKYWSQFQAKVIKLNNRRKSDRKENPVPKQGGIISNFEFKSLSPLILFFYYFCSRKDESGKTERKKLFLLSNTNTKPLFRCYLISQCAHKYTHRMHTKIHWKNLSYRRKLCNEQPNRKRNRKEWRSEPVTVTGHLCFRSILTLLSFRLAV